MRIQFIFAYILTLLLVGISLFEGNIEFIFYAITTGILIGILHKIDISYKVPGYILWGFNIWIILHIFGGLFPVWSSVLYSYTLFEIVGEPYNILKYDQVVHFYCYFIVCLIIWSIVKYHINEKNFTLFAALTVLAAMWVWWVNEIIEFLATVFIEDVNVWWYENTAIDIVANTLWALFASLFFRKIK